MCDCDYDMPVNCVECGALHELNDSRFCKHYKGLCRDCWDEHQAECRKD